MHYRYALGLVAGLLLSSCATQQTREPSAIKTPGQMLNEKYGITLAERHRDFLRYSYKNEGDFLVSTRGFRNRPAAEGFCSVREGYELADHGMADQLEKSRFPIDELRRENSVPQPFLSRGHGGYVFWVKGATVDEESAISSRFDHVLEMLENCRKECSVITRLGPINERIVNKLGREREPLAICVSSQLKKRLSSR